MMFTKQCGQFTRIGFRFGDTTARRHLRVVTCFATADGQMITLSRDRVDLIVG